MLTPFSSKGSSILAAEVPSTTGPDVWSDWLLHLRHADDAELGRAVRAEVERYVDRVLDAARLGPGMTLADIGAGDGAVAFRAIERVGATLQVVLTDISPALLGHAEALARERQAHGQCRFLLCPADRLAGVADASVDAVTTRAVLAYVADKPAALREFYRILKPGGRLSIAEPVLQDDAFMAVALRTQIESGTVNPQDRFLPLLHRWKAAQFPDTHEKLASSPIANYSERNLFEYARRAGFSEVHLELHLDLLPTANTSWEVFLRGSPHPLAPPLNVILAQQFSAEERSYFEQIMRPLVESTSATNVHRIVYLSGSRPIA
jgi:ubiquinone/menaquinone biosynthesis C-methylase UbiE